VKRQLHTLHWLQSSRHSRRRAGNCSCYPTRRYCGLFSHFLLAAWEKSPLRHAIEKGFAPLTVGLVLASAYIMGKSADHDWRAFLLTGLCALIFIFTRTNPLIIVALAGLIGFLGWV
jgi:chromate transport protein ChrA